MLIEFGHQLYLWKENRAMKLTYFGCQFSSIVTGPMQTFLQDLYVTIHSSSENVIMTSPKSDCLCERLLLVHNCIQDNSPWQEQVHLISHQAAEILNMSLVLRKTAATCISLTKIRNNFRKICSKHYTIKYKKHCADNQRKHRNQ